MSIADPFGIVGAVIDGRYRVERVAGSGGFGVVYRALHLAFDAPIAIKVLRLPVQWSPDKRRLRIDAFRREGKLLFKLSKVDPNVVHAFETGMVTCPDGSRAPYLALEWLEGVTLADEAAYRRKCGLGPMSLSDLLQLLQGPAVALGRAHALGIVHRDVKPGNLFVTFEGDGEPHVKILDFGIAKFIEEDDAGVLADPEATSGTTSSFTPTYAAPEQWLRRPTGGWTDVYALALVCVELLAGKPPLLGETSPELMAACLDHLRRPTPGNLLDRPLSPEIEAVFARALAIDPRDRQADAAAFWSALREAARWSPEPGRCVEIACASAGAPVEWESARPRTERASPSMERATAGDPTAAMPASRRPERPAKRRSPRAVVAAIVGSAAIVALAGAWRAADRGAHVTSPGDARSRPSVDVPVAATSPPPPAVRPSESVERVTATSGAPPKEALGPAPAARRHARAHLARVASAPQSRLDKVLADGDLAYRR